jgi:CRISPR-associated protein Csb2
MKLVLEIEFLMGRYVATSSYEYDTPEWPPHPDRLFSALVAAYKETDLGRPERDALEWLETLPAPEISAPAAYPRSVVSAFVPINDPYIPQDPKKLTGKQLTKMQRDGIEVLPTSRPRKKRTFPSYVPESPMVQFIWPNVGDQSKLHTPALMRITEAVTYLGHSSSPIRATIHTDAPAPTYVPSNPNDTIPGDTAPGTSLKIRTITPGRLRELEEAYQAGEYPLPGRSVIYHRPASGPPIQPPLQSLFDENLIVFRRTEGPYLPISATYKLTRTVRDALIARAEEPVPEVISGHQSDGSSSQRTHMAILPFGNVGHRWADGRLMGFALALPRELDEQFRRQVFRALHRQEDGLTKVLDTINLGHVGVWTVERITRSTQVRSLQTEPYISASRTWVTVTPIVLDRFPKSKPGRTAHELVSQACERVGLPAPTKIRVSDVPQIQGVQSVGSFVRPTAKGYLRKPWHHVVLEFEEPVEGPIVLGAGRYLGLGLMRRIRGDRRS